MNIAWWHRFSAPTGEEAQCQDPLGLGPEELRPARAIPARSPVDPGAPEDLPDRGRRHRDAGPPGLAVDPPVSLRLVLPGQPQAPPAAPCDEIGRAHV